MNLYLKHFIGALVFLTLLAGCSTDTEDVPTPDPTEDNQYLVSSQIKNTFLQGELQLGAALLGFGQFVPLITNGIEVHAIEYNTTFKGEAIIASGVICLPTDTVGSFPLISAQRGTIFAFDEAPSENPSIYGFELMASAGYIALLPDLIGFGASKTQERPYFDEEASAQAVIDLVRAAREFLEDIEFPTNDQLFLFGYSEGGYVTAATHKAMEADFPQEFDITATAVGAGAYNIVDVMNTLVQKTVYDSPGFLALIVDSYNKVNDIDQPLEFYFQEPYASELPNLLDGTKNLSGVNAGLNDTLDILFDNDFLLNIRSGSETEITNAFAANSVHSWAPQAPFRLYHSTGDSIIPFSNSLQTRDEMNRLGASVELFTAGNNDHGPAAFDMLELVIPWFDSLRSQ